MAGASDFFQARDNSGWGPGGKAGAGVQAEAAGLALGPRGRPKGKPEPDLTPTKFNTRPLS